MRSKYALFISICDDITPQWFDRQATRRDGSLKLLDCAALPMVLHRSYGRGSEGRLPGRGVSGTGLGVIPVQDTAASGISMGECNVI